MVTGDITEVEYWSNAFRSRQECIDVSKKYIPLLSHRSASSNPFLHSKIGSAIDF